MELQLYGFFYDENTELLCRIKLPFFYFLVSVSVVLKYTSLPHNRNYNFLFFLFFYFFNAGCLRLQEKYIGFYIYFTNHVALYISINCLNKWSQVSPLSIPGFSSP